MLCVDSWEGTLLALSRQGRDNARTRTGNGLSLMEIKPSIPESRRQRERERGHDPHALLALHCFPLRALTYCARRRPNSNVDHLSNKVADDYMGAGISRVNKILRYPAKAFWLQNTKLKLICKLLRSSVGDKAIEEKGEERNNNKPFAFPKLMVYGMP